MATYGRERCWFGVKICIFFEIYFLDLTFLIASETKLLKINFATFATFALLLLSGGISLGLITYLDCVNWRCPSCQWGSVEIRLIQLYNLPFLLPILIHDIGVVDFQPVHLWLIESCWCYILWLLLFQDKLTCVAALIINMLILLTLVWGAAIKNYRNGWDLIFWDFATCNHSIFLLLQEGVSIGPVMDAIAPVEIFFQHLLAWRRLCYHWGGVVGALIKLLEIFKLELQLAVLSFHILLIYSVTSCFRVLSDGGWRRSFSHGSRVLFKATIRREAWKKGGFANRFKLLKSGNQRWRHWYSF